MEDLAKDNVKHMDLWYDRPFVKVLVNKVQELDSGIGAVLYPDTKMVVFIRDGIIIYKVLLDKENIDNIPIEKHVERVKTMLNILDLGLIPRATMSQVKHESSKLNQKLGKVL